MSTKIFYDIKTKQVKVNLEWKRYCDVCGKEITGSPIHVQSSPKVGGCTYGGIIDIEVCSTNCLRRVDISNESFAPKKAIYVKRKRK